MAALRREIDDVYDLLGSRQLGERNERMVGNRNDRLLSPMLAIGLWCVLQRNEMKTTSLV